MSEEEIATQDELEQAVNSVIQRRRSGSERRSSLSLWLISYSDFMTILMIFFLCLYGYAVLAKAAATKVYGLTNREDQFSKMVGQLKKDMNKSITMEEKDNKMVIRFPEKILFESGSALLSPLSVSALDDLANSLKLWDGPVVVEGHADNRPIGHGGFKSNWELSSARAFSVIEGLTQRGIPEERLSAWGFGENRPVATNDTDEGRGQNRRIEVVLSKKGKV